MRWGRCGCVRVSSTPVGSAERGWLAQRAIRPAENVEAPRASGDGRPLPGVRPGVIVHATLAQYGHAGVAGVSGVVDRMLELIGRARDAGREPARLPARYWAEAAEHVLFGRTPPAPPPAGPADHRRPA